MNIQPNFTGMITVTKYAKDGVRSTSMTTNPEQDLMLENNTRHIMYMQEDEKPAKFMLKKLNNLIEKISGIKIPLDYNNTNVRHSSNPSNPFIQYSDIKDERGVNVSIII